MKKQLIFLFALIFTFSCTPDNASSEESNNNKEKSEEQTEEINEEESIDHSSEVEEFEGKSFTAEAIVDGPEGWLHVREPVVAIEPFNMLKIVPETFPDSEGKVQPYILSFIQMSFKLYGYYENYSGGVMVYYDSDASKLAMAYNVVKGKPDGVVTVFHPEGHLMIKRKYDRGDWIETTKDIAGVDWTFDQSQSNLTINDTTRAIEVINDTMKIVTIMPSMYTYKGDHNNQYSVMQKESFQRKFKVNGEPLTGKLLAYFNPQSLEPELYYELNMKDGWLHGEVMIYNSWGELELHERFDEGKLDTTIFKMMYGDGVAKPIIYLYPEKETDITVQLDFDGKLTSTYPKYQNGWEVTAKEDGTLFDENGKEYYALYWEGQQRSDFTIDKGFVISGDETATFLEKSLKILGLNRREANEFIVYWLPRMENNKYNLIHFSSTEYEEMAKLRITPKPETLIRVMMVYKPLETPINIEQQNLYQFRKERKGFTVVEWGGSEIPEEKVF